MGVSLSTESLKQVSSLVFFFVLLTIYYHHLINLSHTGVHFEDINLAPDKVFSYIALYEQITTTSVPRPGRGRLGPNEHDWQDLCRRPLNIAIY